VSGAGVSGRLYCLTSRRLTQDEMALGEIAAHLTSATLDSLHLLARLREAVASEERVRLARNLHDSVLQSLTGIALQLQTARSLLDREPQVARGRLREMQESIAGEQHRVRLLIGELRPFQTSEAFARGNLRARLSDLCDRIERQWGMRIHLGEVDSRSSQYNALHDDIFYLVNEALINAARHAHASSASVIVAGTESVVRVEVEDDGAGFPFAGTYDLNTLTMMNAGPHSLKDRVRTLAGQLVLETGTGGSRIAITLPVQTSRVSLSSVQPA
jgi:signal transduction histidine kinase